jgi:hypothetical protein
MTYTGIIKSNGTVYVKGVGEFVLPIMGTDDDGYPEVIIDSSEVDDLGGWKRKSIKPYIGMKCKFVSNILPHGYNFIIKRG